MQSAFAPPGALLLSKIEENQYVNCSSWLSAGVRMNKQKMEYH